jgi:hypothetical protein
MKKKFVSIPQKGMKPLLLLLLLPTTTQVLKQWILVSLRSFVMRMVLLRNDSTNYP